MVAAALDAGSPRRRDGGRVGIIDGYVRELSEADPPASGDGGGGATRGDVGGGEGRVERVQRLLAHAVWPPQLHLLRRRPQLEPDNRLGQLLAARRIGQRLLRARAPCARDSHRALRASGREQMDAHFHPKVRVLSGVERAHWVRAGVENVRRHVRDGGAAWRHGDQVDALPDAKAESGRGCAGLAKRRRDGGRHWRPIPAARAAHVPTVGVDLAVERHLKQVSRRLEYTGCERVDVAQKLVRNDAEVLPVQRHVRSHLDAVKDQQPRCRRRGRRVKGSRVDPVTVPCRGVAEVVLETRVVYHTRALQHVARHGHAAE